MRGTRVKNVKEKLGTDVELEGYYSDQSQYKDRTITKDELKKACDRLGIEYTEEDLKEDLRTKVRNIIGTRDGIHGKLGSGELWRLSKKLGLVEYLDAEDVDIEAEGGDTLIIDGEEHQVISKIERVVKGNENAQYDKYTNYILDDSRLRLVILENLDKDKCRYEKSVALEEARDWEIYKHWAKKKYVKEVKVK